MGRVEVPTINYEKEGNFGSVSVRSAQKDESIPLVALDKIMQLPQLRLLKIDVEGFEQKVLEGAKEIIGRFRPAIYVENDRIEQSESLINKIRSLGYIAYWHSTRLFNPENFGGVKENLFGKTVSLNMFCIPAGSKATMHGFTEVTDPAYHPLKQERHQV